jgi:hypothetical protein
MGKKKNKNRRKLSYTIHDFKGICCAKCELCRYGAEPSFCYYHVYKQNPKQFIKNTFAKLLQVRERIMNGTVGGTTPEHEMANIFNQAFGGCHFDNRKRARELFTEQMMAEGEGSPPKKKLTKAEKKRLKRQQRKQRYVVESYPYFFCNPGFREEIDKVLYGDNPQQQDKAEEPAGGDKTNPGETTDGSES